MGVRTRVCARGSGSVGMSDCGGRACGEWPRRGGRWGQWAAGWFLSERRSSAGFSEGALPPAAGCRKMRGLGQGQVFTTAPHRCEGERGGDRCPGGEGWGQVPFGPDVGREGR